MAGETKKTPKTTAFHVQAGTTNIVGIGNLRVMITSEPGSCFAQGVEIDYASSGSSLEDVKKRFQDGLELTITEHLRIFGNIEKLLKPAPQDVWSELVKTKNFVRFSQISKHEIKPFKVLSGAFPYDGITYMEKAPVCQEPTAASA